MEYRLVPFDDFHEDLEGLAGALHEQAMTNQDELVIRGMLDTLEHYTWGQRNARRAVGKGYYNNCITSWHRSLAIVDSAGKVAGAATIIHGTHDKGFGRSERYKRSDPDLEGAVKGHRLSEIAAWTGAEHTDALIETYPALTGLVAEFMIKNKIVEDGKRKVWAVEPEGSPAHVTEAIAAAGLDQAYESQVLSSVRRLGGLPTPGLVYVGSLPEAA